MSRSLQERLAALQQSVSVRNESMSPGDRIDALVTVGNSQTAVHLPDLGFERRDDGFGPYWRRALRYDILTYHGSLRFGDVLRCSVRSLARAGKLTEINQAGLRYYDTETTGLGTGAGTIPFLHAVGQFEEDEFVIYQYFLHDYSEEGALLQSMTGNHFRAGNCVVSFNGKSFDWPLYKSRMTMYRLDVPACPQLDLLYPSRRLWKQRLTRVSLSDVEGAILGLQRADDLPGKEAPNRYFTYIESEDARLIDPVLDHNATDVCSLVALTALLANVLDGRDSVDSAAELVALGRLYDEWREYDLAERCFATAVVAPDADWRARWLGSLHYKRRGHWQEASDLWVEMTALHPWTVPPAVELAKYCEHRTRDLESALKWARMALHRALDGVRQNQIQLGMPGSAGESDELIRALRHRVARIQAKQQLKSQSRSPL